MMGQKKTFSEHFLAEESLSEEQLVRKLGKNEGRGYQKKMDIKNGPRNTKASLGQTDAQVQI